MMIMKSVEKDENLRLETNFHTSVGEIDKYLSVGIEREGLHKYY